MNPMPVITGQMTYPENIGEKIKAKGIDLIETDALALALDCGNQKAVNVVLIGLLASISKDFSKEEWLEALKATVPAKLLDINLKAFEAGYALNK
jgi:indolepyruvate ferredoxin oxidoreductase beta subunit